VTSSAIPYSKILYYCIKTIWYGDTKRRSGIVTKHSVRLPNLQDRVLFTLCERLSTSVLLRFRQWDISQNLVLDALKSVALRIWLLRISMLLSSSHLQITAAAHSDFTEVFRWPLVDNKLNTMPYSPKTKEENLSPRDIGTYHRYRSNWEKKW